VTAVQDAPGVPASTEDPGMRGALELRDRAVLRLVMAAASEVHEVAAPVSRVLGQALGSADLDGRVKADVTVAGDVATVRVSLSVHWPAPIVEVAEGVRTRVTQRLSELAGLRVSHVDVQVTALPTDRRSRRRVR